MYVCIEIGKRLSLLSSNKEIFNAAKGPYVEALRTSGGSATRNSLRPEL